MVRARTRKATFNLDERLLEDLSEAVGQGAANSKNAFVDRALRRELNEVRRQTRKALWEEAARDPLFQRDIAEVEADFEEADAETARSIG